jgi:hypothetical protein
VAELYRNAGLADVNVDARVAVYPVGHSRRTIRADLVRAMHPQIIDMGLADENELDQIDTAVRNHLANPDVVVVQGMNFLVWGRKLTNE